MEILPYLLLALIALGCRASAKNVKPIMGDIMDLKLIGTIDGRSFFYESTSLKLWDEARLYCNEAGMHLASLDTKAQYDFLATANFPEFINGEFYWTSARDAHLPRQFTWDDTGTEMSSAYGQIDYGLPFYASCVAIVKQENYIGYINDCVNDRRGHALCEM